MLSKTINFAETNQLKWIANIKQRRKKEKKKTKEKERTSSHVKLNELNTEGAGIERGGLKEVGADERAKRKGSTRWNGTGHAEIIW